jgi:hypothetical protein
MTFRMVAPVLGAAVLAGAVSAKPAAHPLQGQTIDFIASPTGDDAAAARLTFASVQMVNLYGGPNSRGEVDMQSDQGKDLIGFIRSLGTRIAAADILPDASPPGAPPAPSDAFSLQFKEHVVYRMGANLGPSFAAGLTLGLAARSTLPVSYVTEMTLDVTRSDGPKASYACAARLKGDVPRNGRPAPEIWSALSASARDACVAQLLDRMKADRAFFRPAAAKGA